MLAEVKRLLIISHVPHYRHEGHIYAYGPYAREIEIWADLAEQLWIAAPLEIGPPAGDALPMQRSNITLFSQLKSGGDDLWAKLFQVAMLPQIVWNLSSVMRLADAIHVRCPGNLGLVGVLLAPLFSKRLVAKYAGQWISYPGEPWSYRLQRWLLASPWWRGPVTVYGNWPNQPNHIVPFFTSILTNAHMLRAGAAAGRERKGRLRILYVGRLSAAKNVDVLLRAAALIRNRGVEAELDIVGQGPEATTLAELALSLKMPARFWGGVDFERVLDFYEEAHVLVLPSESEGWPKAIAEAMAFGVICIGSNRGMVPQMLGEGRGVVVPPGDVEALADALRDVALHPESCASPVRAAAWAQAYSLEGLREALRNLLIERWGVKRLPITGVAPWTG